MTAAMFAVQRGYEGCLQLLITTGRVNLDAQNNVRECDCAAGGCESECCVFVCVFVVVYAFCAGGGERGGSGRDG